MEMIAIQATLAGLGVGRSRSPRHPPSNPARCAGCGKAASPSAPSASSPDGRASASRWPPSTVGANVTRGRLPGVHYGSPRSVLVCATEDSWEHTIVPRLMAAGADLDRVYRIDVTTSEGVAGTLRLPHRQWRRRGRGRETGAAILILDPLMSRLDSNLDTHKDAEVRLALEPLVAVADRTGVALLGLIHVNKGTTVDPLTMIMGSRAFAAVARAVLFVAVDPSDETGKLRFLGQPKNNLGSTDLPMLGFTIEGTKVADTDEGPVWTGRVAWQGEDARSINEVLRTAAEPAGDRSETDEAAAWLHDYLQLEPVALSENIKQEAKSVGLKERTLKRAREKIGAGITPHGFPRRTWWSRPRNDTRRGHHPHRGPAGPPRRGTVGPTRRGDTSAWPDCPN